MRKSYHASRSSIVISLVGVVALVTLTIVLYFGRGKSSAGWVWVFWSFVLILQIYQGVKFPLVELLDGVVRFRAHPFYKPKSVDVSSLASATQGDWGGVVLRTKEGRRLVIPQINRRQAQELTDLINAQIEANSPKAPKRCPRCQAPCEPDSVYCNQCAQKVV